MLVSRFAPYPAVNLSPHIQRIASRHDPQSCYLKNAPLLAPCLYKDQYSFDLVFLFVGLVYP